jgi:RNA polymerase sigma-70 factor (ECF subfamily)
VVDEVFDDASADDLAHDVSVALMLVLVRLSPLERASFVLHDVFGLDFAEVARALGRGEVAAVSLRCGPCSREVGKRGRPASIWVAAAFQAAVASGDTETLMRLLAKRCCIRTAAASARRHSIRSMAPIGSCGSLPAFCARTHH